MESNAISTDRGYLHRLLVDGVRSFSYRGRVRALLGLPEANGVEMNFPKQLPIPGFSYAVPRFTGRFEVPDELLTSNPPRAIYAEERAPSVRHTAGIPPEQELPSESGMPARQHAPLDLPRELPGKDPGMVAPGCPAVPVGVIKRGNSDLPERQATPAHARIAEDESDHAFGAHDLIVPGISARPKRTMDDESRSGEAQQVDRLPAPEWRSIESGHTDLPGRVTPTESQLPPKSGTPPQTGLGESAPNRTADSVSPSYPTAGGMMPYGTSSCSLPARTALNQGSLEPRPVPRESPDESDLLRRRFKSQLVTSTPWEELGLDERPRQEQPRREVPPESRTFPLAHQPDRRFRSGKQVNFETQQQPSGAADSGQAPTAPATQPLQIVVNQVSDARTKSLGFWERRHLTHLRVKIRR
jgi:hypothetical protein